MSARTGLKVVDGLMSYASDGRGKPSDQQRALYLGAVAFSYAVWENYVEDLAVEAAGWLAEEVEPSRLTGKVQRFISKDASVWELAVHPGWRGLWVERIIALAKGDGKSGRWGLNTASLQNSSDLLMSAGVEPLPQRLGAPARRPAPTRVDIGSDGTVDVDQCLRVLIEVRGQAVHTAQTADKLFKAEVLWWRDFVEALYTETNTRAEEQCRAQLASDSAPTAGLLPG